MKKRKNVRLLAGILVLLMLLTGCSGGSSNGGGDYTDTGSGSYNESTDTGFESNVDVSLTGDGTLSRTLMIYIVGSDLESRSGMATMDIQEMLDAGIDFEKNTVLLCTGGASEWMNSVVSARNTAIYKVVDGDIEELSSSSALNMGKSSTLTSFLDYGYENYPADRFGLILWNHGGGPVLGYGVDEVYGDYLDLRELSDALEASPFNSANKLEFLGFDACLMGSAETAWIFRDHAEYFIASQETEPGHGWDYTCLKDLGRCASGAEVGKLIIDSYFDYYEALYRQYPQAESEITLSCVDLAKAGELEAQLNGLFGVVNEDVLAGRITEISRCRHKTKAFGKFASDTDYDLIDLVHIGQLLSEEYGNESAALNAVLKDYVAYSRSNIGQANGVSIYHPYDNLADASIWIREFRSLGFAGEYADYIENFVAKLNTNAATGFYRNFSDAETVAVSSGQTSDLSMKLTADQQANFSSAKYLVFRELSAEETFSEQTEYLHIFSGQDATLAADGTLSATYNGKAVFGKNNTTGEYSSMPLAMMQIYDGTGDEKFYFPCMFWHYGEDILDLELIPVNWLMKIKNGVPNLLGAYSIEDDEDNQFPAKNLIDSNDYNVYTFANNSYTTSTDANGNIQFDFTGSSYGVEYTKENGVSLELRSINYDDPYYAVFVIEDIYGNRYTSDFMPLKP